MYVFKDRFFLKSYDFYLVLMMMKNIDIEYLGDIDRDVIVIFWF